MQAGSRSRTTQLSTASEPILWGSAATGEQAPGGGPPGAQQHAVTAIVVAHNGARWLPRALAGLAASTLVPDSVVAVDTGSTDGSRELLATHALVDTLLQLPATAAFGDALAAAEQVAPVHLPTSGSAVTEWLWLIHDDCAPEPTALQELLAEADRAPSAAILGPKLRGWHHQDLLVECGLSITNSGRRFTGLEAGDRDQGQRDELHEVLAVGSAGMLVRRDLWQRLGGFDPELPMFSGDIDFCMRARRAAERVVVVPQAVVHHREASLHGVRDRGAALDASLAWDERAAGLYTTLVHGPAWLLPITSVLLLVRTLLSAALLLLVDGPRRSGREIRVWARVHLHPIRVLRARRRLRRQAAVGRRELDAFRPGWLEQWGLALERSAVRARSSLRLRRSGIPIGAGHAVAIAAALCTVAAIATSAVWMSRGPLVGGALLPPTDGHTLWAAFRAGWHDVGLGSSASAAAYPLVLILAAAPPGVSVDFVVQTLLLFTVPMAAVSAFLSLRGLPHRAARVVLAVAYGLAPAVVVPSLDGRVGTAMVAIALPWLSRLVARMLAGHQALPQLPAARVRTAAAAALLLSLCASAAPLTWVAAVLIILPAAALRVRAASTWAGVGLVLLAPLVLLWPWSGDLLADPSRFMFEAGVTSPQLVAQTPPGWRLLLLDPGTLGTSAGWVAAPLLCVAALGLVWRPSRRLAVWGWSIAAIGLAGATVQTSQKFAPLGATTAQFGFAGPMLLLMAVGLIVAATGAIVAVRPRSGVARGFLSLGLAAFMLAGPAFLAVQWITDLAGPLRRTDETVIPAFVAEQAYSSDRIRTLLIDQAADGSVAYSLVNGRGGRIGDADVAPPASTWREVSSAVGELAAGVGPQPVAVLAGNAVRYIVADTRDADLTAALDGNSALRRLSTSDGRGLWEVSGLTTRARTSSSDGEQPVPVLPPAHSGALVDTRVAGTGTDPRLLLAQANDGRWSATLDGAPVAVAGDNQLVVALPQGREVDVAITHDQASRDRALLVPLAGLLLLALLLGPRSHLGGPGPDPDAGDDPPAPAPGRAGPPLDADPTPQTVDLTDAGPVR